MVRFLLFTLFVCLCGYRLSAQGDFASESGEPVADCRIRIAEAKELLKTNKNDEAKTIAQQTLSLAKRLNFERGIFDSYNVLANVALKTVSAQQIKQLVEEIRAEAGARSSLYGLNEAEFTLMRHYLSKNQTDSALSAMARIVQPKNPFDSVHISKVLATRGNLFFRQGKLKEANEDYVQALGLAEGLHDEVLSSMVLGALGSVNKELGDHNRALTYQLMALEIRKKLNLRQDLAGSYNNIASLYELMGKPEKAFPYYRQSLKAFTELQSRTDLAMAMNNIGNYYRKAARHDSCLHYLNGANAIYTQLKDSVNLASNLWAFGSEWQRQGTATKDQAALGKAMRYFEQSRKMAELKNVTTLQLRSYEKLAEIHQTMGNLKVAHTYLQKYSGLSDSVRSIEYTGKIAELQTRYETEKKEKEIARLGAEQQLDREKLARQQTLNYSLQAIAFLLLTGGYLVFVTIQKKRKAEAKLAILERQNAIETMRSKIAGDVHDDMGANLTKLGLNAQQLISLADNERQKALAEKMANQSKEVMVGMKEIIWASNPANDNLKSMLGFMRQYIDRFFDGTDIRPVVRFPHEVGEISLHPEVRRNLFLILKESLNNAVKYSGTDRVDIDFTNENEAFNLNIKDYGKGMDGDKKDDFTNGLVNMKARAEQIAAAFRLVTEPGQGVEIVVEGRLY